MPPLELAALLPPQPAKPTTAIPTIAKRETALGRATAIDRCLMQIADLALSSMAQRSDVEDITPFCVHDSVLPLSRRECGSMPNPDTTTQLPDLPTA